MSLRNTLALCAHSGWSLSLALWLSDHTELTDEVEGLLHVQVKRLECWVYSHVIFVEAFTFCDSLKSFDGPTDELRYVIDSCQYLSIRIFLNKLEQFPVNDLNTGNLVCVLVQYLVLTEYLILFGNILLSKCLLKFISSFLKFEDELVEAFVDVPGLLLVQALDFLLDVLDELPIVIIDALCVEHQLVEVVDVLFDDVGYVLKLSQLVTIVIGEHTLRANDCVAKFAKVLDLFVLMLEAEDFAGATHWAQLSVDIFKTLYRSDGWDVWVHAHPSRLSLIQGISSHSHASRLATSHHGRRLL